MASAPEAAHDLGYDCYVCHSLKGGDTWAGSYSIALSSAIGTPSYYQPIRCDFCHEHQSDEFSNAWESGHPVSIINGDNMSVLAKTTSTTLLDCHNCHRGDSVIGTPTNLFPDLGPSFYGSGGNTATDGYPDHDIASPDNVAVVGDPPHLGSIDNITRTYNKVPSSAANVALDGSGNNFDLCFSCHDGSAKTTHRVNVKQDYIDNGHSFKADNALWGITRGDRIPCSDCHDSHGSQSNARLMEPDNGVIAGRPIFSGTRPTGLRFVTKSAPTAAETRALCLFCHDDYNNTNSGNGTPLVRGAEPTPRKWGVTGHATGDADPCTKCHNPHKTPAGGPECLKCHRTGNAVEPRHQNTDLEFPADDIGRENSSAVQRSGHFRVWYDNTTQLVTKTDNECMKCHGLSHPIAAEAVRKADDNTVAYKVGFIYGLTYNSSSGSWSANSQSFDDLNSNGIIDGNEFCLACHDGNDAASPTDNANIRLGGTSGYRNPPIVYYPVDGSPTGHDRKSGLPYPGSGNVAGQQLCTSCHKYHTSDRAKLFPGTTQYGTNWTSSTYAMPSWAGTGTTWQAPRPRSATPRPTNAGRIQIGSTFANLIDNASYANPQSGIGFGTAGDPAAQHGPAATTGLCDACHRDSQTVGDNSLRVAHTHEGDGATAGSRNAFSKDCLECHNPHGAGAGGNFAMIRSQVRRDGASAFSAVSFKAYIDNDSFDERDGAAEQNADDLCASCHNGPSPVTHNYRAESTAGNHLQGSNCTVCHPHGAVDNAATAGFAQGRCNQCHGTDERTGMPAPGDGAIYHPDANNIIGTRGGDDASHKLHVNYLRGRGITVPSAICGACHVGGGGFEKHPGNPSARSFKSGSMPDNGYVQVSLDNAYRLPGYDYSSDNGYKGRPGMTATAGNGWKTCVTTCHRGASPSWAGKTQIVTNTVTATLNPGDNTAPDNVFVNSTRNRMFKLTLQSNTVTGTDNQATWGGITVAKTGTAPDNAVFAVRVFDDTGTSAGTFDSADAELGSGTVSNGRAVVNFPVDEVIGTTQAVYYVVFDIAWDAPVGVTVGARLDSTGSFRLTSPDNMNGAFPVATNLSTVGAVAADIVLVSGDSSAPASVPQGALDDFLRFRLRVARGNSDNTARFSGATVTLGSLIMPSDIDNVYIYRSTDNVWQEATDTIIGGTGTPAGQTVPISFTAAPTITQSLSDYYFVVLRLKAGANWRDKAGASLTSNLAITLDAPDQVATAGFPVASPDVPILDVPDQVTLTVLNTAPAVIRQGDMNDFLRVTAQANQDSVEWTGLKVRFLPDNAVIPGIETIRVYKDNGNLVYEELADTTLVGIATPSPGTSETTVDFTVLAPYVQTITTTPSTYFVVFKMRPGAADESTVGARLLGSGAIVLRAGTTDTAVLSPADAPSGLATVKARVDTVTVTGNGGTAPPSLAQGQRAGFLNFRPQVTSGYGDNTAVLAGLKVKMTGTVPAGDIDNVVIYRSMDNVAQYEPTDNVIGWGLPSAADNTASITLLAPQTITNTPPSVYYLVVLKLKSTADPTKTVGASLPDNAAFVLSNGDRTFSTNLPVASANVPILDVGDTMTLTATRSFTGTTPVNKGTSRSFLSLAPSVDHDAVTWTGLRIIPTGTVPLADIDNVIVYRDATGDNTWQSWDDVVGWATPAGTTQVNFPQAQSVTGSSPWYFVVLHIAPGAGTGDNVGVRIADNSAILFTGAPDAVLLNPSPVSSDNGVATVPGDVVSAIGGSRAPTSMYQGQAAAFLEFALQVTGMVQDNAATFQGVSVSVTPAGTQVFSLLDNVAVFQDTNGNMAWDPGPGGDQLIGVVQSPVSSPVSVAFGANQKPIALALSNYFFVVYSLKPTAPATPVGAQIDSDASYLIASPDQMGPTAATTSNFTQIMDVPDTLTVSGDNVAPAGIAAASRAAFLRLAPAVNQDNVVWTGLVVTKTGSAPLGALDNVYVYRSADASWSELQDNVIGVGTPSGTDNVAVTFAVPETITPTTTFRYFVVYKVSTAVTGGTTFGARIGDSAAIRISGTADAAVLSPSPVVSTLATVQESTPPGPVTAFTALPGGEQVRLGWTNPADVDTAGAMIRVRDSLQPPRPEGPYPVSVADGDLVVAKAGLPNATDNYIHTGLLNGITYYYAAFSYDGAPNYALAGPTASATPRAEWYLRRTSATDPGSAQVMNHVLPPVGAPQTEWVSSNKQTATLVGDWVSQNPLNMTSIPAGNWTFNLYGYTTSAVAQGSWQVRVYTWDAGVKSELFRSTDSGVVSTIPGSLRSWTYTYPTPITVSPSAKLLAEVWVDRTLRGTGRYYFQFDNATLASNLVPSFTSVAPAPARETGGGTAIACNTCHQFAPLDNAAYLAGGGFIDNVNYQWYVSDKGSHAKHGVSGLGADPNNPVAGDAADTCTLCHLPGTSGFGYAHADGSVDIRTAVGSRSIPSYTDTGTYDGLSRTCLSTYCHAGQATPQAGGESWGYGATLCNSCHAFGLTPAVPATGRHGRHDNAAHNDGASSTAPTRAANASGYSFSCSYCHYGSGHANYPVSGSQAAEVTFGGTLGSVDLAPQSEYLPGGAAGSEGGKLAYTSGNCTVYCHSNGQPAGGPTVHDNALAWTGTAACGLNCHGGDGKSGRALVGDNNAAFKGSRAHVKHVLTAGLGCNQCHAGTVPGTDNAAIGAGRFDNHVNGVKNVLFSTVRATAINQSTGTYDNQARTCSATYCHSNGTDNAAFAAQQPLEIIPWTSATGSSCTTCHGGNAASGRPIATKSHPAHVEGGIACGKCHAGTVTAPVDNLVTSYDNHVNGRRDVKFAAGIGGTFNADNTCSSTYCHGNGTPKWGDPSTVAGCSACHQSQGAGTGPATYTVPHRKHVDNTAYRFACEECHATGAGTPHPNISHAGGDDNAASAATAEVRFTDNAFSTWTYDGGAWTYRSYSLWESPFDNTAPSPSYLDNAGLAGTDSANTNITWSAGRCSSVWCHSNANPLPSGGGANVYRAPDWSGTLGCAACHLGPDSYANMSTVAGRMSRGHWKHLAAPGYGFACDECHARTTAPDNATSVTGYAYHANGNKHDIFGAQAMRKSAVSDNQLAYSAADGRCSNNYCHTDGTRAYPYSGAQSPVWSSGTTTCTSCHGGDAGSGNPVRTGSHEQHVINQKYGCNLCHAGTVSDNVTLSSYDNHVNGIRNVAFGTLNGDAVEGTYDNNPASPGYRTCSGTYCHGTGSSPVWGSVSVAGCSTCHQSQGAGPGVSSFSGAHRAHSDNTAGARYRLACEQCHARSASSHPNIAHAGGDDNVLSARTVEVKFTDNALASWVYGGAAWMYETANLWASPYGAAAPSPGYSDCVASAGTDSVNLQITWSGGSCANVWCHSNANPADAGGGANTYRTPAWDNAATCTSCHLGPDAETTMAAATDRMSLGHAYHAATNNYAYRCDECHADTVPNDCTAAILDPGGFAYHLNGNKKDIRGGASVKLSSVVNDNIAYNDTTHTCTNVYCHSNGQKQAPPFTARTPGFQWTWNAVPNYGCGSANPCHAPNTYPASSQFKNAGDNSAHTKHEYGCAACHYTTQSNDNYDYSRLHANGVKDVTISSVVPLVYDNDTIPNNNYDPPTKTCSGIACHGGNPVSWTDNNLSCDSCHTTVNGAPVSQDTDNFTYTNQTPNMSKIFMDDYTYRGHGRSGALPWGAGKNPAALYGRSMVCLDCHDNSTLHSSTLFASNPFRLRGTINGQAVAADNVDSVCFACHTSPQVREHSSAVTGGGTSVRVHNQKCVDCHDVHGEANIFMVHDNIVSQDNGATSYATSNGYGIPYYPNSRTAVVFDCNATGANFASTDGMSPYNGICEVCHSRTSQFQRSGSLAGPQSHPTDVCSMCHKHDAGFKGTGCYACHGSFSTKRYWPDGASGTPAYVDDSAGDHDNHVRAIGAYLNFGDNVYAYLDNQQKEVCSFCHPNPGGTGHTDNIASDLGGAGRVNVYNPTDNASAYFKRFTGNGTYGNDTSAGWNYDYNTRSCANLACHNQVATPSGAANWDAPPNWAAGGNARCSNTTCHAAATFPAGMYTNAHVAHVDNAQKGYLCTECHPSRGTDLKHVDGLVQMTFGGLEASVGGANGYYDKNNNGSFDAGSDNAFGYKAGAYGSCRSVYCHGGDNSWGGRDNTPVWDNLATGKCGDCHGDSSNNSPPHTVMATGSHLTHFDNLYGPGLLNHGPKGGACGSCHNIDTAAGCEACHSVGLHVPEEGWASKPTLTHADGKIDFARSPTDNSAVLLPATDICNNCHGGPTPAATARSQWDNQTVADYRNVTCESCHGAGEQSANAVFDNTGVFAPERVSLYFATGHGRTTTFPATASPPANLGCGACHREMPLNRHISGVVGDTDRLDNNYARDTVCDDCHRPVALGDAPHVLTGAPAQTRASRHATSVTGNYSYEYACVVCHNPHGTTNLAMVNTLIEDGLGDNAAGVTLLDNLANLDPAGANNGVCDRCHSNSGLGHDNTAYPGNHNPGTVCVNCHRHAKSFYASCADCHGNAAASNKTTWPDGIAPNNPERVAYSDDQPGAHDNHLRAIGGYLGFGDNAAAYNLVRQTEVCAFCHPNPGAGGHEDNVTGDRGGANRANVYNQTDGGFFRKYTGGGAYDNDTTPGWNYAYDNLSCQNLVCHNLAESPKGTYNWNNPPNWASGLDNQCQNTSCHSPATYLNRTPIDNNSHNIHVNDTTDATYPGRDYECRECHVDHGANLRHQSGLVEMKFNNAGSLEQAYGGANGYYDKNRNGSFDAGTDNAFAFKTGAFGFCRNIYCHGADNTAWGGNNTTPEWNNPSTSGCYRPSPGGGGSCHGVYGSAYASSTQGGLYRPRNPLTGNHLIHFRQYDSGGAVTPIHRGPQADPVPYAARGCESCHPVDTGCSMTCHNNGGLWAANPLYDIKRHVDGKVWFYALDQTPAGKDPSYAELAATPACDHCHSTATVGGSVGRDLAKANWDNASYLIPCLNCHSAADPATSRFDGGLAGVPGWPGGTNVLAPAKDNAWTTGGHGRTNASSYPATNNQGANLACATCHAEMSQHITGVLNDNVRLDNGYTRDTLCDDCHAVSTPNTWLTGAAASSRASRHAGSVSGKYTAVTAYNYSCVVCHDAHGTSNLAMINTTITDNLGAAADCVTYTGARTNLDPTGPDNGVCDRCHADAGAAHPDTAYPGNHNQGATCTNCHDHKRSFVGSCTFCHGDDAAGTIWPDANSANNPTRVAYSDDNVGAHYNHILAVGTYLNYGAVPSGYQTGQQKVICAFCHPDPGKGGHEDNVTTDRGGAYRANVYNPTDNAAAYFRKFTGGGAYDNDTSAGWSYAYDNLSCQNLVCHNRVETPRGVAGNWSNPGTATCATCHPASSYTASHDNHVSPSKKGYACTECHVDHAGNVRHTDGRVTMKFNNAGSLEGTYGGAVAGSYSLGDNVDYAAPPYGTCGGIYCHGGDNGWGGTDNSPVWGSASTAGCGACHAATAGSGVLVSTGSHRTHFDNVYGPWLDNNTSCAGVCHSGYAVTDNAHVNGVTNLRQAHDNAAATNLSGTAICNYCHGGPTPSATAKAQWDNQSIGNYGNVTCQSCHGAGEYPANARQDNTWRAAPNAWVNYTGRGHGSLNLPASGKSANKTCTECHAYNSGKHIDNAAHSEDRVAATGNARCTTACHTDVYTHTNNPGTSLKTEATFSLNCDDCHNPHGTSNIFMVGTLEADDNVYDSVFGKRHGGIRLTATSGDNSFDENDNPATAYDDSAAQNADDICVTCHYDETGAGLTKHSGGGKADNVSGHTSSFKGQNCVSCHSHRFNAGGFMPEMCNACHDYPGLAASNRHALSAKHGRHVNAADNGGKGYGCSYCHFDFGQVHNQMLYPSDNTNAWDAPNAAVSVRFDNAANPSNANGPTYAGVNANTQWAPGVADNNGTCAGLYCHGNNATLNTGWTGADNTPEWNTAASAGCGDCHGATASSGNLVATGSHATHFNRVYGPAIDNGTGCTTCHVDFSNTGAHATHVNGSRTVDFRASASDNTVTDGTGTGICTNCHGGPTPGAVAKAQWDNQTVGDYRNVTCLSCHGAGDRAGDNVAHTTALGASDNAAPDVKAFWAVSGHGVPAIARACTDCHSYAQKHYGAATSSNPWRLTQPAAATGDLDAFCAGCHQAANDHFWIGAKGEAKSGFETHPTSVLAYPADAYKQRWYQSGIGDDNLVFSGDISSPYPHAYDSATDSLICVTCHDPHGVGTTRPPSRKFWGSFTDCVAEQHMLRFNYNTGAPPALCGKCHK